MRKAKQIFTGVLTVLIIFSTLGENLQLHASEPTSQAASVSEEKDGIETLESEQVKSETDETEAVEEETEDDETESEQVESETDETEAVEKEVEDDETETTQEESVINEESTENAQDSTFVEQDSEDVEMNAALNADGDLPDGWATAQDSPVTQFVRDDNGGYYYKISNESTSGNSYIGKIFDAQGDLEEQKITFSFDFMYENIGDGAKTQFFMDSSNIKPGTWATRVEIDANGYLYVNGVNKPVEVSGSRVTTNKNQWYTLLYTIDNKDKKYTVQLLDADKNTLYSSEELVFNNKTTSGDVPTTVRVGSFSVSPSISKANTNTRTDLCIDNICLMSEDGTNEFWSENFGESEMGGEEPATPNETDWDYIQTFMLPDEVNGEFIPDGWETINPDNLSAVIEKGTENYFYKITRTGATSTYIGKKFDVADQYTLSFDMKSDAAGTVNLNMYAGALNAKDLAVRASISNDTLKVYNAGVEENLLEEVSSYGWINLSYVVDNTKQTFDVIVKDIKGQSISSLTGMAFHKETDKSGTFSISFGSANSCICIDNVCFKDRTHKDERPVLEADVDGLTVFYEETFNNPDCLDNNGLPEGWTSAGVLPSGMKISQAEGENYYYAVSRSAEYETGTGSYIGKKFVTILPDKFTLSYDFKYEGGQVDMPMYTSALNGGDLAVRMGIKNGRLYGYDGANEKTICENVGNDWMALTCIIDNANKIYRILLKDADGSEVADSGTQYFYHSKANMGAFAISCSRGVETSLSIDNIVLEGKEEEYVPKPEDDWVRDGKVHVAESETELRLSNDYTSVTITKSNAEITSMLRYLENGSGLAEGAYNVLGNGGRGYYLLNYTLDGKKGACAIEKAQGKILTSTDDYGEVVVTMDCFDKDLYTSSPDTKNYPIAFELHYVLEKDTKGVYMYACSKVATDVPDDVEVGIEQSRYAFRLDSRLYQYASSAGGELMRLPELADYGEKLFDATYLINDGEGTGHVYTKYMSTSYQFETQLSGVYGDSFGFSMITPSREWAGGGYAKQDIEVQDSGNELTRLVNWHFSTSHGGTSIAYVSRDWEKLYGPILWHADYGNSKDEILENAKATTIEEVEAWPYKWVENKDYAADVRSVVTGKISVTNGKGVATHSELSPEGIGWAVLSDARSESWQSDNVYYEFYAPVKEDGSFTITDVRPGTYRLNIDINGVMGEYEQSGIVVSGGETKDLGSMVWDSPDYGETLWTIGIADRTAEEFAGGDKTALGSDFRYWGAHLLFSQLYPEGVNFKVGEDDVSKDWYFLHMASPTAGQKSHYDGGYFYEDGNIKYSAEKAEKTELQWKGTDVTPWNILFDSSGYKNGTATLQIAIASSRSTSLVVKLNGEVLNDSITVDGKEAASPIPVKSSGAYPRCTIVGQYSLIVIQFDAAMLKEGENVIAFEHESPAYAEGESAGNLASENNMGPYKNIIYDAVSLSVDAPEDTEADKNDLQELYNANMNLRELDYTAETWKDFDDAMKAAKQVLDDVEATQQEVNSAYEALSDAVEKLAKLETNTSPSPNPSGEPATSPSPNPSGEPVASSSANPSEEPVASPSANPSGEPATSPSPNPSGEPAASPSANPSGEPVASPSAKPSGEPVASPSANPSEEPVASPSANPSGEPVASPIPNPSENPATNPTAVPSTEPTANVQYHLAVENGISKVPPAFANDENLNTPEKIETQMKLNIQKHPEGIAMENIVVYDVVLMMNIGGTEWLPASKENFPKDGLTVTLPYPEGTGKDTHDFVVCHLFTEDMNGNHAGETEYPEVTKTEDGIQFKVYGLSPISVGWKQIVPVNDESGSDRQEGAVNESQAAAPESPKTSDNNHIGWYILIMILSVSFLGVLSFETYRRKKR